MLCIAMLCNGERSLPGDICLPGRPYSPDGHYTSVDAQMHLVRNSSSTPPAATMLATALRYFAPWPISKAELLKGGPS